MSIGIFQLIKNESLWVRPWLLRFLPWVDEIVLYDGNSTDGTLETIKEIQESEHGRKIKLFEGMDPANLDTAYTQMFDDCMRKLSTDLAAFFHPDMWPENPEVLPEIAKSKAIALWTDMESYAGEPGAQLLRIVEGRGNKWKNIYRLRNPDLGAHYHGAYGAANEDIYFSEITGDSHDHHGSDLDKYPYRVEYSGLRLRHFSDVRPFMRRLNRMITCLENQGYSRIMAQDLAMRHPRVTLQNGSGFRFEESDYPAEWKRLKEGVHA